ncbi:LTA synthase family protein [Pectinatus frisingensis]|uniref:LTA synthase family protein n=1 Tax=Pectinatus frisingensis TaxID=865 RepID=UPI0018C74916|nr:alkaline phosphatase family protein [Pectinatus frisingensis]
MLKKFLGLSVDNAWNSIFIFWVNGLKCYLFFWVILSIFRIVFIADMHSYMSLQINADDIKKALVLGMQMSMQTVGVLTIFDLLFLGIGNIFSHHRGRQFLNIIMLLQLMAVSILFVARFPFYRTYHSGFNQMLFTGMHEDWVALFWTMVDQFDLPVRLLGAVVLTIVLFYLWRKFLDWNVTAYLPVKWLPLRWKGRIVFLLLVYFIARLSLFSGSWSWQTQIDWENSAITKDDFLNEAILDDGQAIYRAYRLKQRSAASNGLSYTADDIRDFARYLSGKNIQSDNLNDYLSKQAQGPVITKPRHIFLLISESYANWPLLPEYDNLHIADGMKSVIGENDTAYCKAFLPNGSSTVNALMGVVTGFADANLYLTTMVDKMQQPYSTAIAPQLKKLGYTTKFYYAGPSSWENIGRFTKAQGFDNFYSRSDITETSKGSVWGADDKDLYNLVLDDTDGRSSFNVILNVSNHSPFEVDLKANGFDSAGVKNALEPQYQNDDELLKELGHFWYADKMMSDFIAVMRQKYPDSLFLIVGDHADRYNIEKTPTMYKRYVIPFIMTGDGVNKKLFSQDDVGSQIDIFPTLMELIAPKGFTYYSVGRSLTLGNKIAANYAFAITDGHIGRTDESEYMPEKFLPDKPSPDAAAVMKYTDAIRGISWWAAKYGSHIAVNQVQTAAVSP